MAGRTFDPPQTNRNSAMAEFLITSSVNTPLRVSLLCCLQRITCVLSLWSLHWKSQQNGLPDSFQDSGLLPLPILSSQRQVIRFLHAISAMSFITHSSVCLSNVNIISWSVWWAFMTNTCLFHVLLAFMAEHQILYGSPSPCTDNSDEKPAQSQDELEVKNRQEDTTRHQQEGHASRHDDISNLRSSSLFALILSPFLLICF